MIRKSGNRFSEQIMPEDKDFTAGLDDRRRSEASDRMPRAGDASGAHRRTQVETTGSFRHC